LEQLENRLVPASYSAASVSDLIADITAANTAGGSNSITLAAATTAPYVLNAVNNTTGTRYVIGALGVDLYGSTGLPVIAANDNLTIVGNGDTIERSAATGTPIFRLLRVAGGGSLTLENLTLQGGMMDGTGSGRGYPAGANLNGAADGGAIYNQGTLVLNAVVVQDNGAVAGDPPGWSVIHDAGISAAGGAIFSSGGSVTLEGGTIVQNNEAVGNYSELSGGGAYGGGLYASGGTVTVNNATLVSNTASAVNYFDGPTGNACGGGLCAFGATVALTSASVDGNAVTLASPNVGSNPPSGGGLYVAGIATVTNCTIEDNSAGAGGGLFLASTVAAPQGHTMESTLTNCTVEGNSANGPGGAGGGLFLASGVANLQGDTIESNSAVFSGGAVYIAGITGYYQWVGEDGFSGIVVTGEWLTSAVNATQTVIDVYDAGFVPGETIVIGSEAMTVTATNGTVLTVVRGADGTTAASHPVNASIYPALEVDPSTLASMINNTAPSDPNIAGPYMET